MSVEPLIYRDELLALVIPTNYRSEGLDYFVSRDLFQRLGYTNRESDANLSESMLNLSISQCGNSAQFLVAESTSEQALNYSVGLRLFDVMTFQTSVKDPLEFFGALVAWTIPEGFVIADSWRLPRVMSDPPSNGTTEHDGTGDTIFTRASEVSTNWLTGITYVFYRINIEGATEDESFGECHQVHFFTTPELDLALRLAGLEFIRFFSMSNLRQSVVAKKWYKGLTAREVS
jgi:hypothetical protein